MTRYSVEAENAAKSVKTRGSDLRVHFKNTRETAQAIKGMHLNKAVGYFKQVIFHLTDSLVPLVVPVKPRNSNHQPPRVDGQRNLVKSFSVCLSMLNPTPKSRALTLMLSSSTTSRSTLLPSKEDVPTELTVVSTHTWPPHATSRSC